MPSDSHQQYICLAMYGIRHSRKSGVRNFFPVVGVRSLWVISFCGSRELGIEKSDSVNLFCRSAVDLCCVLSPLAERTAECDVEAPKRSARIIKRIATTRN